MDGWLGRISALGLGGVVATAVYCGKMHFGCFGCRRMLVGVFRGFGFMDSDTARVERFGDECISILRQ